MPYVNTVLSVCRLDKEELIVSVNDLIHLRSSHISGNNDYENTIIDVLNGTVVLRARFISNRKGVEVTTICLFFQLSKTNQDYNYGTFLCRFFDYSH